VCCYNQICFCVHFHNNNEKYLDLEIELQVLWNTKIEIFPLFFGALGVLPEKNCFKF